MAVDSVLAQGGFWLAAAERAVRTFAQTMLAMITVSDRVIGLLDVNWPGSLSAAAFAAIYSLIMSVSLASTGNIGPSAVNERLAIRPQRGRHAVKDPEDQELERLQHDSDNAVELERDEARRRIHEQVDHRPEPAAAPHTPPPLQPVQSVRILPPPTVTDSDVGRDWRPERAGYPTQDGIEHPAQQTGYRDPPTERNLRPVQPPAVQVPIDDLLEPPASGAHRGTP